MYRVKYKADGLVERYKTRLVVKGFTQQEGLDFTETFSPMAKMTTVKTLLVISDGSLEISRLISLGH
mgnify:CR=1 FL=1